MHWEDVPETVERWAEACREPARQIRKVASAVLADADLGWYWNPVTKAAAVFAGTPFDAYLAGLPELAPADLEAPDCSWVKVAYSPTLRAVGETLNFLPGSYPGGIPNHPSPLASMLTTGLLGAGLGWGVGHLGRSLLPEGWGERLPTAGAAVGGLLGATPGAIWAAASRANGKSIDSSWPFADEDFPDGRWFHGTNVDPAVLQQAHDSLQERAARLQSNWAPPSALKRASDLAVKQAFGGFAGWQPPSEPTPMDVNIDAVGRTLWEHGASPGLAAATMGSLYAAQQLPDRMSRPGTATGLQLGQLAANAGGDYLQGMLAGAALNMAIGTPYAASTYGVGNAALGLIQAAVPRLLGQR